MKFRIQLTISGLCMYVPDGDAMHVLMPSGHGSRHDDHEPHYAVLMLDGVNGLADRALPDTIGCEIPLDDRIIKVVGHRPEPQDSAVDCACIPILGSSVNFGWVARECIGSPRSDRVRACLELRNVGPRPKEYIHQRNPDGTAIKYCLALRDEPCGKPNGDCPNGEKTQIMAEHVRWDLGTYDEGTTLSDVFPVVMGDVLDPQALVPLRPTDGLVKLRIAHVIKAAIQPLCNGDEFPMPLVGTTVTSHFDMYYGLAQKPMEPHYTLQKEPGPWKDADTADRSMPSYVCASSQGRFKPGG